MRAAPQKQWHKEQLDVLDSARVVCSTSTAQKARIASRSLAIKPRQNCLPPLHLATLRVCGLCHSAPLNYRLLPIMTVSIRRKFRYANWTAGCITLGLFCRWRHGRKWSRENLFVKTGVKTQRDGTTARLLYSVYMASYMQAEEMG